MPAESNHDAFVQGRNRIASVYAKAYLAAARESGKTDTLVTELGAFVDQILDRQPDFRRLLESAFVSHEQKEAIFDRALAGRVTPELVVFLKVLSRHDRLDCLAAVRHEVARQYRALLGQVDVLLRTARPLDSGLRHHIVAALTTALRSEPAVTEVTEPDLIGGLVITVGDTVYDGSVTTRLARMRAGMVDRCVAAIERQRARFLTEN
jgi:F-type H+-transporting ATPase subunit delta